jgi:hypothetical protein
MSLEDGLNLPKVTRLVSTSSVSESQAFSTLIRFLQSDQDDFLWEDIYHIAESMLTSQSEELALQNLRRSAVISVASPEPIQKHWSEEDPVDDVDTGEQSSSSSPSKRQDTDKDENVVVKATEEADLQHERKNKKKLKKAAKKAAKKAKKEKKAKKTKKSARLSSSMVH